MKLQFPAAADLHFDIDACLNRFVPPSPLRHLPRPLRRFLGYAETPRPEVGNLLICFWGFVGTLCGLMAAHGTFQSPALQKYHPPTIMASFGASAILEYNVIKSPLGQPRNSLLGHTFSALAGVSITKLFMLSPSFDDSMRWVAGAVACSMASVVMTLTNTVHPPGGATAVLAAVDPTVSAMGWALVPVIMVGSSMMLAIALLVNNIQRQFPLYWWVPGECGQSWTRDGFDKEAKQAIDMADALESQKATTLEQDRTDDYTRSIDDGSSGYATSKSGLASGPVMPYDEYIKTERSRVVR